MRKLRANEIECKVSQITEKGLSLLLYKTARTDMDILDEEYGTFGWKCKYEEIKGNMYCTISIYNSETREWVEKQDCGVESAFGDKEKGEASDAFKRAGFKVGIGRELYTSPFIHIPASNANITKNAKGNAVTYDKFEVSSINYDSNGDICHLTIINSKTRSSVYDFNSKTSQINRCDNKNSNEESNLISREEITILYKKPELKKTIDEYFSFVQKKYEELTREELLDFTRIIRKVEEKL